MIVCIIGRFVCSSDFYVSCFNLFSVKMFLIMIDLDSSIFSCIVVSDISGRMVLWIVWFVMIC